MGVGDLLLIIVYSTEQPSWEYIRQAIQTQESIALYMVIAIGVLVGVILGGTTLTNFILHKRAIKQATDEIGLKTRETLHEDYDKCVKQLETKFQGIEKEVGKVVEKEIAKLREDTTKEITILKAEKARLFAIVNDQILESLDNTVKWWATATKEYAKVDEHKGLRISIEALIRALRRCTTLEKKLVEKVEECLPLIPPLLDEEKEEIKKLIRLLKD